MIGSALICLPLTMEPLIQVFEVVGSLVRVINKYGPFSVILITSVSDRYVVAILDTTATAVSAFGDIY